MLLTRRAALVALLGSTGCSLLLFDAGDYGRGARDDAGANAPDAEAGAADAGPGRPDAEAESFVVVAGGSVQMSPSVLTTSVFVSKVGADGQLSPWTEWTGAAALPEARHRAALVAFGDALLFVGGYTASDGNRGSVYQSTFAPLGAPWSTALQGLPAPRGRHGMVTSGRRLYVTGGRVGSASTTSVVVASLDESGVLGSFAEARAMPSPRELHVTLARGRFLWVLAGYDATSTDSFGDGWVTEIASDGSLGSFKPVATLPDGALVNTAAGAATDTHLYFIGGSGSTFGRVFASKYRPDGTLEGWLSPAQLLTPRTGHAVVEVNGRLYAIGGHRSSSELLSSVEVADIAPDGSLSAWRDTTPLPRGLFTHSAAVVQR